jgi:transcription factor E2F7/8
VINIDHCIEELGIGRRRIYDIINILESFQMIKRLKKNEYEIKAIHFIKEMINDIEVSTQFNSLI